MDRLSDRKNKLHDQRVKNVPTGSSLPMSPISHINSISYIMYGKSIWKLATNIIMLGLSVNRTHIVRERLHKVWEEIS